MKALVATYALAASLALPTMLWAADDPPSDPAAATTPAQAPAPPEPAQGATTPVAPAAPATVPAPPAPGPAEESPKADAVDSHLVVSKSPPARAAASSAVTIKGFAFGPSTITVNAGDRITWTNQDSATHTATAKDGSFDTGNLAKGESGSHTFSQAGTFAYICSVHPNMKGTVVVKAASSNQPDASGSGSGGSDSSGGSGGSSSSDPFSPSGSSGSDAASSSSSLPSTGLDAGLVALAGLLLIGGGALLRRRLDRAGS